MFYHCCWCSVDTTSELRLTRTDVNVHNRPSSANDQLQSIRDEITITAFTRRLNLGPQTRHYQRADLLIAATYRQESRHTTCTRARLLAPPRPSHLATNPTGVLYLLQWRHAPSNTPITTGTTNLLFAALGSPSSKYGAGGIRRVQIQALAAALPSNARQPSRHRRWCAKSVRKRG